MQNRELILDYDEFKVFYDHLHKEYVFYDPVEDEMISLQLIATLDYLIDEEPWWVIDLDTLFDNFCCGERVTDDNIIYYWFKEK